MNRFAFARLVSIVGHPFAFVTLLLLLPYFRRGDPGALRVAALVVAAGLVPLGVFMRQRYTSGKWATVDASARTDRPMAYLAGFAVLLPLSIYFFFVERSGSLVRGCASIAAMFGTAFALNRWIKLSGHLAFAGFTVLVLARIHPTYAIPMVCFIPVLGWSRLALLRHTIPEVIGGLILGVIAGTVMVWS
jgi:hypothetical protein